MTKTKKHYVPFYAVWFDSSGRTRRDYYLLNNICIGILAAIIAAFIGYVISHIIYIDRGLLKIIINILASCIALIPILNLIIRRAHDYDSTGEKEKIGYIALIFVPNILASVLSSTIVGVCSLIFLIAYGWKLLTNKGVAGKNKYGEDPLHMKKEEHTSIWRIIGIIAGLIVITFLALFRASWNALNTAFKDSQHEQQITKPVVSVQDFYGLGTGISHSGTNTTGTMPVTGEK